MEELPDLLIQSGKHPRPYVDTNGGKHVNELPVWSMVATSSTASAPVWLAPGELWYHRMVATDTMPA